MKRVTAIILSAFFVAFCFTSCKDARVNLPEEEQIKAICELTTVKAYYNNLAKSTKNNTNILNKDRDYWFEYEGYAKIGIDMSKVSMTVDDNTITIVMPNAELQQIGVNSDSFDDDNYIASADGFLFKNKIDSEDLRQTVKIAQEEMEKEVLRNTALFTRAQEKAKTLIENYINKLGEMSKIKYTIVWEQADE